MQTKLDDLLHANRIKHGNHCRIEGMLALMRQSRRLACVVISCNEQHPAMLRRTGCIGVLEHVTTAVYARTLAVPHGEHPVVLGPLEQPHLLRTPDSGGGQLFIHAGLEADVMFFEVCLGLPQGLIKAAKRGAPVTGYEPSRIKSSREIALTLDHRQTD